MTYWIHFGLVTLSRSNYGTNEIGIKIFGRKLQKDPKCSKTILYKVEKQNNLKSYYAYCTMKTFPPFCI